MKTIVIQHLDFENLGTFEESLRNHHWHDKGLEIETVLMAKQPVPKEAKTAPILIILGGPISANDEGNYPFIKDELSCIRDRLDNNLPTLGVCLGAQLLAKAMGAKIHKAPQSEIGWDPVHLTEEGMDSAVRALKRHPTTFHWHGEMFEIPKGALRLAFSKHCPNQAFSYEKSLGIQFHPEVTSQNLESWYVGHAHELENQTITSIQKLREDALQYGPSHNQLGGKIIEDWLQEIVSRP